MFNNYCLFAQAIHDTNRDEIVMYELLLRKFDGEKWVFPSNFFQSEELEERYPIFIDWLKLEIAKVLKKLDYAKVSLNINSNQLFYLETIKMFESLRVYKDLITIEITEDLAKNFHFINRI
ncbi:EAL domain-containing protein [Listeria fleischmannii]|uniref:Diguanylate phosphodiesterase n=1 Tax=Listeria fleischmannii FSL S10-1203 TaxID=1265822 RepID=W7DIW4_9LIST|nr:EAL domain-containing protein [Listeria fleischmannii]EUJ47287.1 diguanylate phosphodiesterase [Listeria fleischmannii FSL S10-1203]